VGWTKVPRDNLNQDKTFVLKDKVLDDEAPMAPAQEVPGNPTDISRHSS